MKISEAQQDMRRAYVGGGPGVLVSGCVWCLAALVQQSQGIGMTFAVLFVGGMLIFPLSKLIVRFGFHRDNESPENPLGITALGLFDIFVTPLHGAVIPLVAVTELAFGLLLTLRARRAQAGPALA